MKNLLRISALAVCVLAGIAFASDFKSVIISGTTQQMIAHVGGDHFLVIRNFTQQGAGSSRGFVTVSNTPIGGPVNVLAAAIVDPATPPGSLEVINSVIIAGPADVTVMCGADTGSSCFISFKKDSE